MPPEPLPWDRFKERRYDRPPPDGAGPGARWRDASPHNGFRGRLPGNGRPVPWRYHSAESGRGFTPSRVNDKFIGDDGFRSPGYRMDGRYNRFNRDSNKGPFGHRDTRGHTWENDMSPNSSGRPYFGNDQRSDDDRGSFVPKDLRDHCWENGRLQNGSDQRSLDEKGAFGRREMRGKYWENGNVQSSADDRAPYEKKGLKRRFSPENGGLSNSSGRTHISNDQRPVDDKGSSGQRNMRGKSCENGALLNSSLVDKDVKNRSEEKGVVLNSSDKVQSGNDQTPSENLQIFTSPTHSEQSKDQCDKSSGANDVVLGRKVENENPLVSIDWKPIKWSRSGSLSSRGSLKSPDSAEPKTEMPPHNATPLHSPSGDAAVACATVSAVSSEEGGSKKKLRLGWGEGLAKFEKKKVEGPDEDSATKPGLVVSVSGEPSQLSNLADKSPSVAGFLECVSPATPSSAACRFSPGVDDKACVGSANLDYDINLSGSPNLLLQEHTEGNQKTEFCLENVDHISVANISSSLTELLQLEDPAMVESNFVRSTAMNKLLVWRGEALKALEVTESEIDSFENDLKKLISESASISSSLVEARGEVRNEYIKTPLGEVKGNMNIDVVENLEKCPIYVIDDGNTEGPSSSEGSGHLIATLTSDSPEALCDRILTTNKETAIKAYETFSSHCNIQTLGTRTVSSWKSNPRIMEKFAFKKRCRKFQERVNILKYKALQHLWKEDLQLMSLKKNNPKSHKRLEIGSRVQHGSNKKHRSFRSRVSNAAGNLSLVPTDSAIDFTSKLLSEAQVKPYRNSLKMPALIMNKKEMMTSRFISNNGLVEDPCAVEKERKIINPWIQEEKDLFMDKFATFGKDFNKISSFLDHKTTADCVEFYYKNHKSDCFVKLKKIPDLAKQGKSYSFNNYLVGSGKRRDRETNAASLDVLGEASEIAANADNAIMENRQEIEAVNGREIEAVNDRETEAAGVLAGICGSISSEAMGSCVTSSFDRVENYKDLANQGLSEDDLSCSDDDSLEEMEPRAWTDEEKSILIEAFTAYGNDFIMISRRVGTKSRDQCKLFFSKARKRFGLNSIRPRACAEGEDDNNGGGSDVEGGACVVEGNSAVSSDKSSSKVDKDVVLFDADMNNVEKSDSKEPVESGSSEKSTSKVDKDAMLSDVDMNNVEKSVSKEPVESVSSEKSTSKVDKDATLSDVGIHDLEKNAGKDCDESEKIVIDDLTEEDKVEVDHECDVKTDNGVENTLLQPDIEEGGRTIGEKFSPVGSVSADVALTQEQEMVVENNLNNEDKEENLNDKQHEEIGNFVQDLNHDQDLSSETASKVAEASSDACVDLGVGIRQEQRILLDLNPPLYDVGYKFDMIARKLYNKSDNVNTCAQHESGSSGVLVGYPLQVPVNRELNADMYTSHGSFLSRCSGSDAPITPSSGLEFPFCFQEPKKSHLRHNSWSSSDTEKPKSKGDVKLFGQILKLKESKNSTNNVDSDLGKLNRNNYLGLENVPSRSCGVWDDNRTVPSVPNSAILLAKYPAAFGNFSSTSNIEHQQGLQSVVKSKNNDLNLNGVSVFPPREITNANGVVDYQLYMNQQDLISEMQRRNAIGAFSSLRNPIGANVGISDPVAAIKMHYAKVDQYANNVVIEEESWRGHADLGR